MANAYDTLINNYTAQQREQEALLKQQRDNQAKQLRAQVDNQIGKLNTAYQDNAQNAYIQREQSKRDLPQQLAAQGVSGGLSESGNIALNSNYGNVLSGYKRDRDSNEANLSSSYTSDLASLDNTYLGKAAEVRNSFQNLIAQQRAAQLQAQEQARQAELARQASIQAAVVKQKQQEQVDTEKKLKSYINGLSMLSDTGSKINYLNSKYNMTDLTAEEAIWLANQAKIDPSIMKQYLTQQQSQGRPYMTVGEWNDYITPNKDKGRLVDQL